MTVTVDFLPFATAAGANVESQAAYAADSATLNGFSAGIASSAKFNKAMRQATFVAAAFANWIASEANQNVADDGVLGNFEAQISAALSAFLSAGSYLTQSAASALFAALSSFANSLGSSGYQKLPGGLILQWGTNPSFTNQALNTVTFPIAFPNACIFMIGSLGTSLPLTSNQIGVGASGISSTQGQVAIAATSPGTSGASWWALGK